MLLLTGDNRVPPLWRWRRGDDARIRGRDGSSDAAVNAGVGVAGSASGVL